MLFLLGAMLFFVLMSPERRWDHWVTLCFVLSAPILSYVTYHIRDQARFMVWAPFHRGLLTQTSQTDGVVTWWDTWGGLGWFNSAYLLRDGGDDLASLERARAWRERESFPCEIVATQRVWRHLYVVTTSECEL
jgi:hypothetical protein